jgi:hypothetical protein
MKKDIFCLGIVQTQLQVFHFENGSIIPFPQITIKNNIGTEMFEIIFLSFLNEISEYIQE